MTTPNETIEQRRLELQVKLDAQKSQEERNRLGQFATPTLLARDVVAYGISLLPKATAIRFLDPALGTGSFYSALLATAAARPIEAVSGFEIDPHYAIPASTLWAHFPLHITQGDFTRLEPPAEEQSRFNLLICNPPYVRHHHLASDEKMRLQKRIPTAFGSRIDGLTGLYVYFLAIAHDWMQEGGVAGWLIPSEFMDVNYGRAVKHYFLEQVTLLHIHRFDPCDVQFGDALVSSALVFFRKGPPPSDHNVTFSYGSTLADPSIVKSIATADLRREAKWTRFPNADVRSGNSGSRLGDYFRIKRGIATGDNQFFILRIQQIEKLGLPKECFQPILPSPRYLDTNEIAADDQGNPLLERKLFLLNCRLPEEAVRTMYPALWAYLQTGKPAVANRYLCRNRHPWYSQEERPPTPFICTYLGRGNTKRGRPFRFILNRSRATAANVYLLLYPKPLLAHAIAEDATLTRKVWEWLNAIQPSELLDEGRVYGGGLHKLEPKELANVHADGLKALLAAAAPEPPIQRTLFDDAA